MVQGNVIYNTYGKGCYIKNESNIVYSDEEQWANEAIGEALAAVRRCKQFIRPVGMSC